MAVQTRPVRRKLTSLGRLRLDWVPVAIPMLTSSRTAASHTLTPMEPRANDEPEQCPLPLSDSVEPSEQYEGVILRPRYPQNLLVRVIAQTHIASGPVVLTQHVSAPAQLPAKPAGWPTCGVPTLHACGGSGKTHSRPLLRST